MKNFSFVVCLEMWCILGRKTNGLNHTYFTDYVFARYVKRRPVIHACAQNGHSVCDRDSALEVKSFGGDMSLVVIEG